MLRKVIKLLSASRHEMGEHQMYQPLPNETNENLDPFLLVHHHGPHYFEPYNRGLPFGPHPHRGFETLTFIYSGSVEHADSQGFKSVIHPGGVQWMTAGRGIVHSENIPYEMRENGGDMEILQLWMNLPARLKMTPATYQGFQKEEILVQISEDGLVETQLIAGERRGEKGPAVSLTNLEILNVYAQKGGKESFQIPANRTILLYILKGEVLINGKFAYDHQLVEFAPEGEEIEIEAKGETRFILCSGEAIGEPIVQQGPFVMNTTTQILEAMRDYQMGKMGFM